MKSVRGRNAEKESMLKRKLKAEPLLILVGILLLCNVIWFIAWLIPNKTEQDSEKVASVGKVAITRGQGRRAAVGVTAQATEQHEEQEEEGTEEPRKEAGEVKPRNRGVGEQPVEDEVDRGRDEDAQRPSGGDGAEEEGFVVAVLPDLRNRHRASGCRGRPAGPRSARI